jgi:hypothetical protein
MTASPLDRLFVSPTHASRPRPFDYAVATARATSGDLDDHRILLPRDAANVQRPQQQINRSARDGP